MTLYIKTICPIENETFCQGFQVLVWFTEIFLPEALMESEIFSRYWAANTAAQEPGNVFQ